MTLSDLSVRRPVLAAVAAILLCVAGAAAFLFLPVRELPAVDPPIVSIQTNYPGASAEVVEERITQPIEQRLSGAQDVDRVISFSRDGISRIQIVFTLKRDLESAANDVRDAISRVAGDLPPDAKAPTVIKSSADATAILSLGLTSDRMSRIELGDYATRYIVPRLATISGVGQVGTLGASPYSMRVWLDADALTGRGLTVDDVQNALLAQNVELPAGALESTDRDFSIRVNRRFNTPESFAELPIIAGGPSGAAAAPAYPGLSPVRPNPQGPAAGIPGGTAHTASPFALRLGDIARIEEGPAERRAFVELNGRPEVGISVTRQSQANDLQISRDIRKAVGEINRSLPQGMRLEVIADYSQFTADAIAEVWLTMGLALAVVAGVNLLFLGSWRAAVVPTVVAPICIVSTFTVLALLGFSLNLLTLLALVLAIGLVVDDAIVVVENIQRRINEGEPPIVAAVNGSRQVYFAVAATTAVLMAVFAPMLVLPGYVGRLFAELAVAVMAAVFFSALLALSLSPMLSSILLKPGSGEGRLVRLVDSATEAVKASYAASLSALLQGRLTKLLSGVLVVLFALAAFGLLARLPKELVPSEDRGRVDIAVQAPEGTGFDSTVRIVRQVEPILENLRRAGIVERYAFNIPQYVGNSGQFNTGLGTVVMNDWRERKITADDLAARLNRELGAVTGARLVASVRGPIQGGTGSGVDFIATGDDYGRIAQWIAPVYRAALANRGLARPRLDYNPSSPRLVVDIDDRAAAALGVAPRQIGDALQAMVGSKQVTTYVRDGQQYDVTLQTDLDKRRTVEDLDRLSVRTAGGGLAPLSSVVRSQVKGDTPERRRTDYVRSITLSAGLNPGYTVGEAVKFYQDLAARQPPGVVVKWGGQAKDFLEASRALAIAFGAALLLVFLVLAAQFESWIHPAVVMLTTPLAALGGLLGLVLTDGTVNTYSEIGLIILIGIAAKNGVLIVEYANQLREEGKPVREAVIDAAALRLRPILMTSVAAAFGALPLILNGGPGAGSRKAVGVVIFYGAMFATIVTLFVVPIFYDLLARFTRPASWRAKAIEAFAIQTRGPIATRAGSADAAD